MRVSGAEKSRSSTLALIAVLFLWGAAARLSTEVGARADVAVGERATLTASRDRREQAGYCVAIPSGSKVAR